MSEWDWMRMVLIDDSTTNQIPTIHFPSTADVFQVWLCLPIPFLEGTCCLRSSTRQEFRRTKLHREAKLCFLVARSDLFNLLIRCLTYDIFVYNIYIYLNMLICRWAICICMQSMNISFLEWMDETSCAVTSRDYAKLRGSLVDSTSGESTNSYCWWFRNPGKNTWDVWNPASNGSNYSPQLVNAGISGINSINGCFRSAIGQVLLHRSCVSASFTAA